MRTQRARLTVIGLTVLAAASIMGADVARQQYLTQQTGPLYNVEGAWYGIVTIPGLGEIPSLDTFTASARNPSNEGSGLCTIPVARKMVHPLHPGDPAYWLSMTASAHANWVKMEKNRYAFTAVRTVFDQDGSLFGRARHWGTVTPISADEYTGTMNIQFYDLDENPMYPQNFTGTLHSRRIEIIMPEE